MGLSQEDLTQDITASGGGLDLRKAATEGWAMRSFPVDSPREPDAVPVVIRRSVLSAILAHGQSYPRIEVCGVLVGNGYRDEHGPFVYVEAIIEGTHAAGQAAEVTFTSDTWAHINEVMDREHPEQRIIGWYHTHPGFGIFLSAQDLFIHHSFFSAPEQLALVYDPSSGEDGLFVWQEGKAVQAEFLVEEDMEVPGQPAEVPGDRGQPAVQGEAPETAPEAQPRKRSWIWITLVLLAAVLGAVGWWLLDRQTLGQ